MARPLARHPLAVNLAIQAVHVRAQFPDFSCRIHRGVATWCGILQPREVSPWYTVEICYKWKRIPKARVICPNLAGDAPHRYKDGILCLYWPREWRWSADQLIADTIVPWSALWLLYYELWLDTGEWLGPSSHQQVSNIGSG